LGGSDKDFAFSIIQDQYDNIYVAGNTRSFDGDISGNHGWVDSWLVKLDNSTNLDKQEISTPYSVFPNPSSTHMTFSLPEGTISASYIEIYDISGSLVKSVEIYDQTHIRLDVTDFKKGLYFYKFKNCTVLPGRFIVQ
jgi:hypothetical protein